MVCGVQEAPREDDEALRETARALGHVSDCVAAAAASPALSPVPPNLLTCRSFVVFETLDKGFVHVVVPQLGLSGPAADDTHFQLKNFITDVLVTRHWFSHGHSLSVTQIMRAIVSLLGTIAKLRCDPVAEQAATAVITACIADVHARHVPACPVALSVSSIACLFFTRALQRLCKAINVADISLKQWLLMGQPVRR